MLLFRTYLFFLLSPLFLIGCKTSYRANIYSSENILIDTNIGLDSSILAYYQPFKIQLENEMNRQIGYSHRHLDKIRSQPEFLVGNFFADALLYLGKQLDPETEIALATKDGIRSELKQGPITVGSIYELMPFENSLTLLEIKGSDLMELCNFIAKTGGQPIAGFRMQIKDGEATNIRINDLPINMEANYKLVTYDYLANGGDHVKGILRPINRINSNYIIREQLIKYVEEQTKQGKAINTQLDGRITLLN